MLFSADHSESLLYGYFHEFYGEVVRLKQLIGRRADQGSEAPLAGAETLPAPGQITPFFLHQRLLPILERQRVDAAHRGGEYGANLYREAQYLMAGLADEIFLHRVQWEGREAWRANLLEARLFDTYIAGERVFANLDKLLRERNPVYAELARIYLIALSLGFQGRYRNSPNQQDLEHYRKELFTFITKRDPDGLYELIHHSADKRLFPETYAFTVKEAKSKPLPSLRKWYLALGLAALGLLLASHLMWRQHTAGLRALTETIMQERDF